MEIDRLADLPHQLGPKRIDPVEQPLEQCSVREWSSAGNARQPFV